MSTAPPLDIRRLPTTSEIIVRVRPPPRVQPPADKCGEEGLIALFIGGTNVPRGRFPWVAPLYHDDNPDPYVVDLNYKCVTTLVSTRTVVTAAHCIWGKKREEMRVYVGRHDLESYPEEGAVLMEIQSVHTHPDFIGDVVPDSDIGILVFTTHATISSYVRPICMWSLKASSNESLFEEAVVVGWGVDKNQNHLRFPKSAEMQIVSRETCQRKMISAIHFLTSRTLCAGNKDAHGPCSGDSGAGLMVKINNQWTLRAVVSTAQRLGNTCDLSGYVIYSDVSKHLQWIESKIVR
ncbi:serine protease gd-like isoform X2 [Scaptodrosophila lebanonensis]|nr:serine protease gd-like isoform X2 [Scaptodrosophila lebanonensis]